jgi:hypothetical protein
MSKKKRRKSRQKIKIPWNDISDNLEKMHYLSSNFMIKDCLPDGSVNLRH